MRLSRLLAPILLLASALASAATVSDVLRQEIEAADRALFDAAFESCDADAVGRMVTEDFEFFHDKWGQIARSRSEFVAAIRGSCERQQAGTDFKARRELLVATHAIYPMKSYGALQSGMHAFFRIESDKSLTPTEYARFTHLWKQESGRWLLSRVISYDHVDGPAPANPR
jgi:ketosteroid isomerase-like protein